MTTTDNPLCPSCARELTFVRDVDMEVTGSGSQLIVPLASSIYRCADHGLWRASIAGDIQRHREPITE